MRALAYILAHGGDGLRNATLDALLNANYIRHRLEDHYKLAYQEPSMHECVFSDDRQAARGVGTGDIAKRLIDYGFHPYTVSFPLILHGALMIEPTETEAKEELDLFVDAMRSIAAEIEHDPELVKKRSPHDEDQTRGRDLGGPAAGCSLARPRARSPGRRLRGTPCAVICCC